MKMDSPILRQLSWLYHSRRVCVCGCWWWARPVDSGEVDMCEKCREEAAEVARRRAEVGLDKPDDLC